MMKIEVLEAAFSGGSVRGCRRAIVAALLLAATVLPSACGGDSTGPLGETTLKLRNNSTQHIQVVNFSACAETTWGPDRLGETETIAPGGTRQWTITAGCWDVRAQTQTRTHEWHDRQVAGGRTLELVLLPASE